MSKQSERSWFGKVKMKFLGLDIEVILGKDGVGKFFTLYGNANPFEPDKIETGNGRGSKDTGGDIGKAIGDLIKKNWLLKKAKYVHIRNISFCKFWVPVYFDHSDKFFPNEESSLPERKLFIYAGKGELGERSKGIPKDVFALEFSSTKAKFEKIEKQIKVQFSLEDWEKIAKKDYHIFIPGQESKFKIKILKTKQNEILHSKVWVGDNEPEESVAIFEKKLCWRFDLEAAPVPSEAGIRFEEYTYFNNSYIEWKKDNKIANSTESEEEKHQSYFISHDLNDTIKLVEKKDEKDRSSTEKLLLENFKELKKDFQNQTKLFGSTDWFEVDSLEFGIIHDLSPDLRYKVTNDFNREWKDADDKVIPNPLHDHPFIKLAQEKTSGKDFKWVLLPLQERILYGLKEVGLLS